MDKSTRAKITFLCMGMVVFLLAGLFSGCSGSKFRKSPFSSRSSASKAKQSARYMNFADVMVPGEMKRDDKNTAVYQTSGLTAGVLSLKGRVETNSLVEFFEKNMVRDNWALVSAFKSKKTILLFQKENRYCVVNISGGDFSTRAEIWVAPTTATTPRPIEEGLIR